MKIFHPAATQNPGDTFGLNATSIAMKKHFIKALLLFCHCVLAAWSVGAQVTFTVNSPASIGGEYGSALAAFGATSPCLATGELALVNDIIAPDNDACTDIPMNLTGKIALVKASGICEYSLECLNAQEAGAVAVVVCNDQPGAPTVMGMGNSGALVTIPCIMISQADCMTMESELGNGVAVQIECGTPLPCGSGNTCCGILTNGNSLDFSITPTGNSNEYEFSLLPYPTPLPLDCGYFNQVVSWDFGDGTVISQNDPVVTHQFQPPLTGCKKTYGVKLCFSISDLTGGQYTCTLAKELDIEKSNLDFQISA
ncbi:MAG: PA domain-containing protein, partial [Bacteroidota bacterium]